jgi:hypothetical protein
MSGVVVILNGGGALLDNPGQMVIGRLVGSGSQTAGVPVRTLAGIHKEVEADGEAGESDS